MKGFTMFTNTKKVTDDKKQKKAYLSKACIVCYDKALVKRNNTDVKCETCGSVYPLALLKTAKG